MRMNGQPPLIASLTVQDITFNPKEETTIILNQKHITQRTNDFHTNYKDGMRTTLA